ncbi:MAG: M20/M25/M40 family metallo-hydrolase, partial [Thermoanaerobaculia bacterium]
VVKGQWPTTDSPLLVDLRPEGEGRNSVLPAMQLAERQALADLPAVFSQSRLMEHVQILASPDFEGRGVGTAGLDKAAEYLVEQFERAGLQPGGDNGGYLQRFTMKEGPDGSPVDVTNVIGVLPGTRDEWQDQAVIIGAHFDHLGSGWPDVHSGDEGKVHPGADDNASGVAVLIELARTLAEGEAPQRSLVFAGFTGEEAGRAGSKYYVANPTPVPFSGIRAVVNIDTVGRLGEGAVSILGTGTADEWQHIFRGASYVTGVDSRNIPESAEASDQMSFIEKGVPGVQIFTQAHGDYHRPGDTADKVDGAGLVKVATLVKEAVVYLGGRDEPMTVKIEGQSAGQSTGPPTGGPSGGRKVRFGTVPDFAFEGPGVRVSEVSAGSPAEKAGFLAGDTLVAIDDQEVTDLRTYSQILRTLEPGQNVEARVVREGKEIVLPVTVEAR